MLFAVLTIVSLITVLKFTLACIVLNKLLASQ